MNKVKLKFHQEILVLHSTTTHLQINNRTYATVQRSGVNKK